MKANCQQCNTEFSFRNPHTGKFCSMNCYGDSKKNITPPHLVGYSHSELTRKKLSALLKGRTVWNKGKGKGWIDDTGYRVGSLQKREHREIAEEILGRPLKRREVIHHIDENKLNNNPSNLYLFRTNTVHIKFHCYMRRNGLKGVIRSNLQMYSLNFA